MSATVAVAVALAPLITVTLHSPIVEVFEGEIVEKTHSFDPQSVLVVRRAELMGLPFAASVFGPDWVNNLYRQTVTIHHLVEPENGLQDVIEGMLGLPPQDFTPKADSDYGDYGDYDSLYGSIGFAL